MAARGLFRIHRETSCRPIRAIFEAGFGKGVCEAPLSLKEAFVREPRLTK